MVRENPENMENGGWIFKSQGKIRENQKNGKNSGERYANLFCYDLIFKVDNVSAYQDIKSKLSPSIVICRIEDEDEIHSEP